MKPENARMRGVGAHRLADDRPEPRQPATAAVRTSAAARCPAVLAAAAAAVRPLPGSGAGLRPGRLQCPRGLAASPAETTSGESTPSGSRRQSAIAAR